MSEEPIHYFLDDGSERWEVSDQLHREDGPALITPEGEFWYRHGKEMPPEEVAVRLEFIAEAKRATEAEARQHESDAVVTAMEGGTSRPVVAMRPLRFGP